MEPQSAINNECEREVAVQPQIIIYGITADFSLALASARPALEGFRRLLNEDSFIKMHGWPIYWSSH